ncbi:hypothetical protein [Klebsiella quasipneumoniae]|nr:hypothetical protein [Klebsiella quasipneumoniae]MCW9378887.1 hypothetical protein [Klebsiella quasipneumoniae]MCW9418239.1 hypothetical protein [Klebsiella quasipneumoniae]
MLIEKIYVPVEKRGQGIARRMVTDAITESVLTPVILLMTIYDKD